MFDEMSSLFRSFDNLFQSALQDLGGLARTPRLLTAPGWEGESTTLVPAVECFTRDKNVVLRAELPGVDPDKVEISVLGDRLVLRGEKESQRKEEDRNFVFQEVSYGRFERSFVLPEGVKAEDIKANFQNGVLEVSFPAKELSEAKRIPITGGSGTKKQIQAA
jgi:HSP20 family protein